MKKLFLIPLLFLAANLCAATSDRFGNSRDEVTRSSFTDSNSDVNVLISSASKYWQDTGNLGGPIYLRSVTITGRFGSTVTFYDTISFTDTTSTAAKVIHQGNQNASVATSITEANLNIYISSGLMYSKVEGTTSGNVSAIIKWDYAVPPVAGGKGK